MLDDFTVPPVFGQDWFERLPSRFNPCFHWIFIGPKGAHLPRTSRTVCVLARGFGALMQLSWVCCCFAGRATPTHIDPTLTHAWLTQIRGRKRFILFPPQNLQHCHDPETGCFVDPLAPDLEKFKGYSADLGVSVIIEEGETLFVPCNWACVTSSNHCNSRGAPVALRSTRPPLTHPCAAPACSSLPVVVRRCPSVGIT